MDLTRERMNRLQVDLAAYAKTVASTPCVWGKDDCTMFAARWAERVTGLTIGHEAYESREDALVIINAAGGLLPLWEGVLSRAGINESYYPQYGDIGLIQLSFGPVGVIMTTDNLCMLRTETGLTYIRPRNPIKFWSV